MKYPLLSSVDYGMFYKIVDNKLCSFSNIEQVLKDTPSYTYEIVGQIEQTEEGTFMVHFMDAGSLDAEEMEIAIPVIKQIIKSIKRDLETYKKLLEKYKDEDI